MHNCFRMTAGCIERKCIYKVFFLLYWIGVPAFSIHLFTITATMSFTQTEASFSVDEAEAVINRDHMDLEAVYNHDRNERFLPATSIHESSAVRSVRFMTHAKRGEICVVEVQRSNWKDWVDNLVKVLHVQWIYKNDYCLETKRQEPTRNNGKYAKRIDLNNMQFNDLYLSSYRIIKPCKQLPTQETQS